MSGDCLRYDDEAQKEKIYASAQILPQIIVTAKDLTAWDSTLLALLYELAKIAAQKNKKIVFSSLPDNLQHLVDLALKVDRKPSLPDDDRGPWLEALGNWGLNVYLSMNRAFAFCGQVLSSCGRFLRGSAVMRGVDFLFALEGCSYKAVGIMSLVSFMIGLILAFVGAVQLKTFGAQIYVASLVTIGMTRIMGAIMAGVIMSGRTGASYAATIGTMQVNEEIDALKTMGIPTMDFLVLPRMLSLMITMPLLTIWADFMGMFGGAFVGDLRRIRRRFVHRPLCERRLRVGGDGILCFRRLFCGAQTQNARRARRHRARCQFSLCPVRLFHLPRAVSGAANAFFNVSAIDNYGC